MRTLLIEATQSHQLERTLRARGHEVVRCDGIESAQSHLVGPPFDVVIVDLALAGIDFQGLSAAVRSAPWGEWCQILVLSASETRADVEQAIRSGADDYLVRVEDAELVDVRLGIAERRAADNAARRRMIESLSGSEDRFRDLLETAPDAIFRVGTDGRIQLVNGNAERMTGYSRHELIGQPIEILVPAAVHAVHVGYREGFVRSPATRPMGSRANLTVVRKDGSEVPIDICLGHHRASGLEYTIAAVRDVTERRRLEDDLRRAKEAAEHAYDRIRRDMDAAARVQRALLPATLPDVPGICFAWEYQPCAGLAGDGLNVFMLDDDHVGLYLLDVSGHGVAAALLSVSLARLLTPGLSQSSMLRVPRPTGGGYDIVPPHAVATQLNQWVLENPAGEQYFTILYGVLEVKTRRLRFVSAGHPGLLHGSTGARPQVLQVAGFPIGYVDDAAFEESVLDLEPGDRLFLYSDGVTEAMNPTDEQFGEARLVTAAVGAERRSLQSATHEILAQVLAWTGNEPHDDVSVLALEVE